MELFFLFVQATFQGLQLMTSAGACTAPLANAMIN